MTPDDPYFQYEQRLLDITREANYALWNALLTFNAILIGVFSAVAIYSSLTTRLCLAALVLASMISAALLIMNFHALRNLFRSMGQTGIEGEGRLPQPEKDRQLDQAVTRHGRCNLRENVVIWIHAVQAIGVLVLIVLHP